MLLVLYICFPLGIFLFVKTNSEIRAQFGCSGVRQAASGVSEGDDGQTPAEEQQISCREVGKAALRAAQTKSSSDSGHFKDRLVLLGLKAIAGSLEAIAISLEAMGVGGANDVALVI